MVEVVGSKEDVMGGGGWEENKHDMEHKDPSLPLVLTLCTPVVVGGGSGDS